MRQTHRPFRLTNAAVPFALALILCAAAPARSQNSTEDSIDAEQAVPETVAPQIRKDPVAVDEDRQSVRAVLAAEIARMETERATIARFAAWQAELLRAAKSDPVAALAQRLPMSECRASVLEPICHRLTALFAPEKATGGAGGTTPAPTTGTGEEAQ